MFVRAVRFSGVEPERVEALASMIGEAEGPPPGIPSVGVEILYDEQQRTVLMLDFYATAEDMEAGGKVLDAMDSSQAPGKRESVDMSEIKLERHGF